MHRKKKIIIHLLLVASICSFVLTAQQQEPSEGLLQQSRLLIEQRDFDKAKLSLNLYQKYVKDDPVKWLSAQAELIKITFEENKTALAKNLFIAADKIIEINELEDNRISQELSLLKSNFYALQNNFQKSNKILEKLIKKYDDAQAETYLLNNHLDEAILDQLFLDKKVDIQKLSDKVTVFESGLLRNPIDVLRLKNKLNLIKNPVEDSLETFEKLADLWIPKDEYLMILIHLYSRSGNDIRALSIWEENKDIINIKSFAGSVAILTKLAAKLSQFKIDKTNELIRSCQHLIRNEEDRAILIESEIELLIKENSLDDAITMVESFLKNNPKIYNASSLRASICLALIDKDDLVKTEEIFSKIEKNTDNPELKARLSFIEANILNTKGQGKQSAALFLRVGQTSKDKKIISTSLYKAGLIFEELKQYESAIIAFTQLLEKRRTPLTDQAYERLYKVQIKNEKYDEALNTIEAILNKSITPVLKEEALYDKGHILMKTGDSEKAIQAFLDFSMVYPKDSRSPQLLFEIYGIQKRSLKNLEEASKTLDSILKVSKEISPDIYARALHHRALLFYLNGDSRQSISLWQKYLEFTRTLEHPLADEVKLQLAAVYQNSAEYDDSTAFSIFADIAATTKDDVIRNQAIENLVQLKKYDDSFKDSFESLFRNDKSLSDTSLNVMFTWMHELKKEGNLELLTKLKDQVKKSVSPEKASEPFWLAQLSYFSSMFNSDKQKATEALRMGLKLIEESKMSLIDKSSLKLKILEKLGDKQGLLDEYLNVIYYFQNNFAKDNYTDWQPFYDSCFNAVSLLKDQNKIARISSLRQRLADSKLPGHEIVLKRIDDLLKVKVEKSSP